MRRRLCAIGLFGLIGCGRIGFDPAGSGGADAQGADGADGASVGPFTNPCPVTTTAPSTITVSGKAISSNFVGTLVDEPKVLVTARSGSILGTPLGSAVTDSAGRYSIPVATGGLPIAVFITLEKSGFLTTAVVPDQRMDRDFDVGESFMGTPLATGSLYNAGGAVRNAARGTVFIFVSDCAGAPIGGATVSVSPAPGDVVYSNGFTPSSFATSTASNGHAWALNAPAGPSQVSASRAGLSFATRTVEVLTGDYYLEAPMRAVMP